MPPLLARGVARNRSSSTLPKISLSLLSQGAGYVNLGAMRVTVVEAGISLSRFQGSLFASGKKWLEQICLSFWVNLCSYDS